MNNAPILLLAAGSSTRMGQPKQLLPWGNQTLIEHQIKTYLKTGQSVFVVLGANAEIVLPVIEKLPVSVVINENWNEGMGNSLAFGVHQITAKLPEVSGILITLLDQPLVTASYLEKMLDAFSPGAQQIIVSQSASGWKGVPVLFDKSYFKELLLLQNEEGAKKVIKHHTEKSILMEAGELLEDTDTPQSYRKLFNKHINFKII